MMLLLRRTLVLSIMLLNTVQHFFLFVTVFKTQPTDANIIVNVAGSSTFPLC